MDSVGKVFVTAQTWQMVTWHKQCDNELVSLSPYIGMTGKHTLHDMQNNIICQESNQTPGIIYRTEK